jgi:hypothetical protein
VRCAARKRSLLSTLEADEGYHPQWLRPSFKRPPPLFGLSCAQSRPKVFEGRDQMRKTVLGVVVAAVPPILLDRTRRLGIYCHLVKSINFVAQGPGNLFLKKETAVD